MTSRNPAHRFEDADQQAMETLTTAAGKRPNLRVVRTSFREMLAHALRATYPVVERMVGTDRFRELCEQFVQSLPTLSGVVSDYGDDFGFFLDSLQPAQRPAFLGDLARLEWACGELFCAVDGGRLDPAGFRDFPRSQWHRVRAILNPACRLIASTHPLLTIWTERAMPPASREMGNCRLLLRQRGHDVEMLELSPGEFKLLEACREGADLLGACEIAIAIEPELDLLACLHKHARLGSLCDLLAG